MDLAIGPLGDDLYSVILNEVVFGFHAELRSYAARLNASFLLSSLGDAVELLEVREALAEKPDSVLETIEDGDFLVPVAIHMLDPT